MRVHEDCNADVQVVALRQPLHSLRERTTAQMLSIRCTTACPLPQLLGYRRSRSGQAISFKPCESAPFCMLFLLIALAARKLGKRKVHEQKLLAVHLKICLLPSATRSTHIAVLDYFNYSTLCRPFKSHLRLHLSFGNFPATLCCLSIISGFVVFHVII